MIIHLQDSFGNFLQRHNKHAHAVCTAHKGVIRSKYKNVTQSKAQCLQWDHWMMLLFVLHRNDYFLYHILESHTNLSFPGFSMSFHDFPRVKGAKFRVGKTGPKVPFFCHEIRKKLLMTWHTFKNFRVCTQEKVLREMLQKLSYSWNYQGIYCNKSKIARNENRKKTILFGVFFFQKYGKFGSISLEVFVEDKPWNCEEWADGFSLDRILFWNIRYLSDI